MASVKDPKNWLVFLWFYGWYIFRYDILSHPSQHQPQPDQPVWLPYPASQLSASLQNVAKIGNRAAANILTFNNLKDMQ